MKRKLKFRYLWSNTWHYIDLINDKHHGTVEAYKSVIAQSPLVQYTGLKDKNGKEIYEDDILNLGDWHGISDIFIMNGSWKVKGRSSKIGVGSWTKQTEIIGNIYENPELLK